jgi:gamma-glutamylaminecyclotransferase
MHRVFVYGTLKKNGKLHHYLKSSEFLGDATISGFKLYDVSWFPGIKPAEGEKNIVHGEVYAIDDKTLKTLDMVEGAPTLYRRETVEATVEGVQMKVFTYIFNGEVKKDAIPEGIWRV